LKKKLFTIVLFTILGGLVIIKFWDTKLFDVRPYFDPPEMTYITILSLLIALLGVLSFPKKSKRGNVFRFSWMFVASFVIFFYFMDRTALEKIDYLFSSNVKSFQHEVKKDRAFWTVHTFVVDSDTLYFFQNSRMEEIYLGEFEMYKSNFTHHYHIRPKTK
jgi:hypothetical protein